MNQKYILINGIKSSYAASDKDAMVYKVFDQLSGEEYNIRFTKYTYFYNSRFKEHVFLKIKFFKNYHEKWSRKNYKLYNARKPTAKQMQEIKDQYPEFFI